MSKGLPVKDPYSHILNMMRSVGATDNPPTISIAKVLSASPLTVLVDDDLQIDADNIMISDALMSEGLTILKAGDEVATLPTADGQTYIILCRVVSM